MGRVPPVVRASRNYSQPDAPAALREWQVREVQRSSALLMIVRPVSARAAVHLPTLKGCRQSSAVLQMVDVRLAAVADELLLRSCVR